MGAIGILALGLWLVRAALDSERIEVAAIAIIALPIILGAAIGKLFGNAMTGAAIIGLAYWLLAFSAVGIAAIGGMISKLAKWIW
jgi:hypothetical protein